MEQLARPFVDARLSTEKEASRKGRLLGNYRFLRIAPDQEAR